MQRRGKRLSEYLNESLNALNTEYLSRGEQYVYSQKELAVFANVSRETIRKHQGELDEAISTLSLKKYSLDKDSHAANLKVKISKLENDLTRTIMSYEALRVQYLHVISVIVKESLDISKFIRRDMAGVVECPICNRMPEVRLHAMDP